MSKYTTEVRFICENAAGYDESTGYEQIDKVIANSREKIFNFSYPIFDREYKSVLETKILKHYYLNEICCETVGQWKLFLNARLNEIMPYYNKLYESETLKFDPLTDTNYQVSGNRKGTENRDRNNTRNRDTDRNKNTTENEKEIRDRTGTATTTNTSEGQAQSDNNTTGTNWDYFHDTPQGGISQINDETWLTNARKVTNNTDVGYSGTDNRTDNGNTSSEENENVERGREENEKEGVSENEMENENENVSTLDDYIESRYGKSTGTSYSKMLQEFRETFLNIDMLIIDNLSDLFFGLWDAGI